MTYAIFGGGISGLAAAFYLKNVGVKSKIILFESSSHLGGWIRSCRNENGTLFELGPRTLRYVQISYYIFSLSYETTTLLNILSISY